MLLGGNWHRNAAEDSPMLVDRAVEVLQDIEFKAIVCCGVSGSLIAPLVADRLGKALLIVRKPDERSVSGGMLAGQIDGDYIIIDDLIDTGRTMRHIRKCIGEATKLMSFKYKGIYLYAQNGFLDTATRHNTTIFCYDSVKHCPLIFHPENTNVPATHPDSCRCHGVLCGEPCRRDHATAS